MRNLYLFSIAFLMFLNCLGQELQRSISDIKDHYSNFMPVTPNASTFTRYGNTSINLSKGTPSINIPIYTINVDDIKIPISLSYDATGIKVDDLSTAVGLKWRLQAGGGVFRTVNNLTDENGWCSQNFSSIDTDWYNLNSINEKNTQDFLAQSPNDHSPDNFIYSINNYFGSFIFERQNINSILKDNNNNLTIKALHHFQVINSFKINDEYGNLYEFGLNNNAKEYSGNIVLKGNTNGEEDISTNLRNYLSSWLISRITTKNNKIVSYNYIPYDMDYTIFNKSEELNIFNNIDEDLYTYSGVCYGPGIQCGNLPINSPSATFHSNNMVYSHYRTSIHSRPKNKLISNISTDQVSVDFFYENFTSNAVWKKRLAHIIILDKIKNNRIEFQFSYDFYPGSERLRLKEVLQIKDTVVLKSYKFLYNENHPLPNYNTNSRDYYGYFNGKDNSSIIPITPNTYAQTPSVLRRELADKRPVFEYLVSGNLSEIQYPTGGSTKFEYEVNQENNGYGNEKFSVSNISIHVDNNSSSPPPFINGYRNYRKGFTITEDTWNFSTITGNANISINSDTNVSNCLENNSIDCAKYYIYKDYNTLIDSRVLINGESSYNLTPGNYFIVLKVSQDNFINNLDLDLNIDLKWVSYVTENNITLKAPSYAGGLRIKRVYDTDINGNVFNDKNYVYSNLVGSGADSFNNYNRDNTLSSDILTYPSLIKSGYFYKNITVNNTDNSKIVYSFERKRSNYTILSKPKSVFYYNENSELLKKIFFNYKISNNSYYYNVLGEHNYCYSYNLVCPVTLEGYGEPQNMIYNEYYNYLNKKIVTKYFHDNSIVKSLSKIESYKYNIYDLIREYEINNDVKEIENINDYLDSNYEFSLSTKTFKEKLDYMQVNNYRGLLRKITNFNIKNNVETILSTKQIIYNNLLPFKIQTSKGTNPLEDKIIYNSYDNKGNPLEVSKVNGIHTSYIWGYNKTQPIAKIENIKYTDLPQTELNALLNFNYTTGSEASLLSLLANLRSHLPNTAMITTMTYKPLIGVSTITDPKGDMQTYFYDNFNRLKFVKDADGNILSENEYHYRE